MPYGRRKGGKHVFELSSSPEHSRGTNIEAPKPYIGRSLGARARGTLSTGAAIADPPGAMPVDHRAWLYRSPPSRVRIRGAHPRLEPGQSISVVIQYNLEVHSVSSDYPATLIRVCAAGAGFLLLFNA
jgi:hypothetical protein